MAKMKRTVRKYLDKRRSFFILFLFALLFTFTSLLYSIRFDWKQQAQVFIQSPSIPPIEGNGQFITTCQPRSNIVFLKTHKCASSTVQNILLRYGSSHSKMFVMPRINNYLGHPSFFNRNLVPPPVGYEYNMLCHHTRFNYNEMNLLMPNNTLFVTIVREPADHFESMFNYVGLGKFYKMKLKDFEEVGTKGHKALRKKMQKKRKRGIIGLNQMMFDLGGDPNRFDNLVYVKQRIRELGQQFDFVMVAELMDESLILLKQLMCWNIQDMVVFKVNARGSHTDLSPYAKDVIRTFNSADSQLYAHFREQLERRIDNYGRLKMKAEVVMLRLETTKWQKLCVGQMGKSNQFPVLEFRNKKTKNDTCRMLTTNELELTDYIRKQQLVRFPNSVFKPNN